MSDAALILPFGIVPEREGGREHDVRFDQGTGRWLKFTKSFCTGYCVHVVDSDLMMLPATPLQYLERWLVFNRIFNDDAELVGLYKANGEQRLVISQRDVTGEAPSWDELEDLFIRQMGMKEIKVPAILGGYGSRSYVVGRLGLFDVRPGELCENKI